MVGVLHCAQSSSFDDILILREQCDPISPDAPSLGKCTFPSSCTRKIFFDLDLHLIKFWGEIQIRPPWRRRNKFRCCFKKFRIIIQFVEIICLKMRHWNNAKKLSHTFCIFKYVALSTIELFNVEVSSNVEFLADNSLFTKIEVRLVVPRNTSRANCNFPTQFERKSSGSPLVV